MHDYVPLPGGEKFDRGRVMGAPLGIGVLVGLFIVGLMVVAAMQSCSTREQHRAEVAAAESSATQLLDARLAEGTASPSEFLEAANAALRYSDGGSADFRTASRYLEYIGPKDSVYKEAQALAQDIKKMRLDALATSYRKLLAEQDPSYNWIQVKTEKTGGGYALWGVHEFYTEYSFSAGSLGPAVYAWMDLHHSDIMDAKVRRVGVRGIGEYATRIWFKVEW